MAPIRGLALSEVSVSVTGADGGALDKRLRGASALAGLQGDASAQAGDILAAARSDYGTILDLFYEFGYYGAEVSIRLDGREAGDLDPFGAGGKPERAVISVDAGPIYRFGGLLLSPLARGTSPIAGFTSGAPARASVVRAAIRQALDDWRRAGHPKARVADQRILVKHSQLILEVKVALDPGPSAVFGGASISGDTEVRPDRVRDIAGLPEGDPFTPDAVDEAERRLRETGTFQSARVIEGEITPDGSLPMIIDVVDRAQRRIGAGVEFSSFDGITLSGFWLHRNLLGGAERLRLDGRIEQLGGNGSDVDFSVGARFERPAVIGPDTLFFAEAQAAETKLPDVTERKIGVEAGLSRRIGDNLIGELGVGVTALDVKRTGTSTSTTIPSERSLLLVSLPAALTWDKRDDEINAKDGTFLRVEAEPFYESRQGTSGFRIALDARGYKSFGAEGRTVLAGRFQLGSVMGPSQAEAPPGFLFFSGGGGTVRGQPFESLGTQVDGVTLGGRSFANLSAEMRVGLTGNFGMVGFVDAGYVGPDSDFTDGDVHAGAGLGLRYTTPVGPIRFDVGAPITSNTGDGVQLYVGIGQAF